ncbi:hypothetical protein Agub_g14382, partial [Astrephomene gubernaculifera]
AALAPVQSGQRQLTEYFRPMGSTSAQVRPGNDLLAQRQTQEQRQGEQPQVVQATTLLAQLRMLQVAALLAQQQPGGQLQGLHCSEPLRSQQLQMLSALLLGQQGQQQQGQRASLQPQQRAQQQSHAFSFPGGLLDDCRAPQ